MFFPLESTWYLSDELFIESRPARRASHRVASESYHDVPHPSRVSRLTLTRVGRDRRPFSFPRGVASRPEEAPGAFTPRPPRRLPTRRRASRARRCTPTDPSPRRRVVRLYSPRARAVVDRRPNRHLETPPRASRLPSPPPRGSRDAWRRDRVGVDGTRGVTANDARITRNAGRSDSISADRRDRSWTRSRDSPRNSASRVRIRRGWIKVCSGTKARSRPRLGPRPSIVRRETSTGGARRAMRKTSTRTRLLRRGRIRQPERRRARALARAPRRDIARRRPPPPPLSPSPPRGAIEGREFRRCGLSPQPPLARDATPPRTIPSRKTGAFDPSGIATKAGTRRRGGSSAEGEAKASPDRTRTTRAKRRGKRREK